MVMNCIARSAVTRALALIIAGIIFTGCVNDSGQDQGQDQSTAYMQGTAQASADYYLQQMRQGSQHSRINWQLLAIRALLQAGEQQQAQTLYQQLPDGLDKSQQDERTLLAARLALLAMDSDTAIKLLDSLTLPQLTSFQQQRYWQIQIDARHGEPSLMLLRALIARQPLLSGADKQKNIDATWQALTEMTPEQINNLVIDASEYTLRGWLDLQHSWWLNRSDPALLQAGIKNWQTRYPQNPAAQMLPTALSQGAVSSPSVEKIGLFLPLQGQGAVFGEAIRQGFIMAKNTGTSPVIMPAIATAPALADSDSVTDETTDNMSVDTHADTDTHSDINASDEATDKDAAQTDGEEISKTAAQTDDTETVNDTTSPTSDSNTNHSAAGPVASAVAANPDAELKIYDTSSRPVADLLQQAQQDGVMLIVGPLLKDNVTALSVSNSTLNVLALNQPQHPIHHPGICYFALSPEDEASDAAVHIWQQGQRQPLLLVPGGELGNRIARAFASAWQQLGGGEVLQQNVGSVAELKQAINHNIGISLKGTPVNVYRSDDIDNSQATPADSTPATQQTDILLSADQHSAAVDAVYIIASQQELALIRPMIGMNTSSRTPIAYYASSRSAQGGTEVDFRIEMDGLQFSDFPMLAGANPALMQQALTTLQGDYSLARLYAMGADAWTLANYFTQLQQTPGFIVQGNTGQLSADQNCVIHRTLTWLKYQQGKIVPVP